MCYICSWCNFPGGMACQAATPPNMMKRLLTGLLAAAVLRYSNLVARPSFCYSVPAIRMAMDLLVYLSMLVLFGSQVLLYDDEIGLGEIVFFAYVLVSMCVAFDGR